MSIFSPYILNCIGWFFPFFFGSFYGELFFPIKTNVFILWLIWFCVSSFIFFILQPRNIKISTLYKYRIKFNYEWIIFLLILQLLYKIYEIGSSGPSDFFLNLRLSNINAQDLGDFKTLGWITYLYPLIISLFVFESLNAHNKNKKKRIILYLWLVCFVFASMSKFSVLTVIYIPLILIALKVKIKTVKIVLSVFFTFIFMMVIQSLRAGNFNIDDIFNVMAVYIYSPIVALGYLNVEPASFGIATFRFFYIVLHSLGLIQSPILATYEYVNIPIETNVFTTLLPFYYDFGQYGAFFSIIYGLLFGILYRYVNKNIIFTAMYILMSMALLTQFFAETIFSVLSMYLQCLIYLILFVLLSRRYHD
ncbi:O-antigen polymerase [Photobacterium leiognathi]|uniref:O-antigen polymerase n=1 Tax=Photobacterium leiognathi TaxID=553611 RepID=UPI002735B333|nr:O-antigen polymerase [Photobacterium leiognathi]